MQLSNKECKYRNKVMCENHFKKDIQKYIDSYIVAENNTYKNLYLSPSLLCSVLLKYNFSKLSGALQDFGASCAQATKAFQKLAVNLYEQHGDVYAINDDGTLGEKIGTCSIIKGGK